MLKNERKVVCSNLSNTVYSNDYIVDNVRDEKTLDILKEMITDLS